MESIFLTIAASGVTLLAAIATLIAFVPRGPNYLHEKHWLLSRRRKHA
jgi:hypothetical protein